MTDNCPENRDSYQNKQGRQTDKEIKEIHNIMASINTGNEVNAANLKNLTGSFKDLATSNNITHQQLFVRTESLNINIKELETRHKEHIQSTAQNNTNKNHRCLMLVSWVAICISVVTVGVLVVQSFFQGK